MKLTGKCKEDFDKWKKYRWMDDGLVQVSPVHHLMFDVATRFDQLPEAMKYGVLVDFFDSVGIDMYVLPIFGKKCGYDSFKRGGWCFEILTNSPCEYLDWSMLNQNLHDHEDSDSEGILYSYKTRPQARTAAIEKANEIYNLKN